jgi:two-component system, NarL family, nitrate/nitrite response regulator NarL
MKAGFSAAPDAPFSNGIQCEEGKDAEKRSSHSPENPTRILLVDDHPVLRKGLMACLENRINLVVVGEAADGLEAVHRVSELQPDLVLMDVEMPHMDGLAATKVICKEFPKTRVLILSMHNNPDYIVQAVQMGARGFALKSLPSEELVKAIEIVQRGEPFFTGPAVPPERTHNAGSEAVKTPSELFEREKEVLTHLAAGYGNREIAELLNISVRTVESHRARLMKKLNIHTIAGLTRYALAHGLISLEPDCPLPSMADHALHMPVAPGLRA